MRGSNRFVAALTLASCSILVLPMAAFAAETASSEVDEAASAVAAVAPGFGSVLSHDEGSDGFVPAVETSVAIPLDPSDPIAIENGDLVESDLTWGLGLPTASNADDGVLAQDGSVVYVAQGNSADVVVEQTAASLRVLTVIPTADSPTEYPYEVTGDAVPRLTADGGAELVILDGDAEIIVGVVQAPWAFDANGEAVATSYEVRGDALVQVVAHDESSAYPVVADPTFTQINFAQWRFRWNKAETKTIASGGWGATALTAICAAGGAKLGPIGAAAAGAVCFAHAAALVYNAGIGVNTKPKMRCVQLTWTSTPGVWNPGITWVDTYAC